MGTEASFFMLILEGCMNVQIGKEGFTFESKSFSYFGAQALLNATLDPPVEYIPDYTVRPSTDCIVIIITKREYRAAIEATQFEEEKTGTVSEASESVVKKPKQDVFAKEWELAEDQDLQDSASTGLSSITKFLSKKHVNAHTKTKNSDKRRLLTESSEESDDSPPLHRPLTEKQPVEMLEDRFQWLSSSQNGDSSIIAHSDVNVLAELHVLPGTQDSNSDSGHRTSVDREEWALNTSSEV